MKIIFMGTAELSCASLEKLARDEQFSVAAVVTQPDKPKGRELETAAVAGQNARAKLNLPVLQPLKARDEKFIAELRESGARLDRRRGLRTDSAAGHFGFADVRLPERPHVAVAEISRRRADPMGHRQRRN